MNNKTLIFILAIFGLAGSAMLSISFYLYFTENQQDMDALLFLFGMGIIFFAVAAIPFLIWMKKFNIKKELLQNGHCIEAKVMSIDYNTMISVNGRSPFVIHCQWVDPLMKDKLYLFKSENIWFDPTDFIEKKTITVYLDENNPKRYYVDIRFLPKI